MTDITVSRELLRQVAEWSHLSNGPEQLYHLQKALRAALEQSVVKPDNLQCKSVQEPVHKLIYPGGGKALFNRLWHLTCNAVATQSGMRVRTDVMPMREMKEFLDHLCVLVDSPPQPVPAPVQEQQPAPASKPVLLQCLGCERVGTQEQLSASTDCDCWLHTQPAPVQEPEIAGYVNPTSLSVMRIGEFDWIKLYPDNTGGHIPLYTEPQAQTQPPILTEVEVERLTVFAGLHDIETPLLAEFIRAIERVVRRQFRQTRTAPQAQPSKAVKLSDDEISTIAIDNPPNVHIYARAIEQAVLKANGIEP